MLASFTHVSRDGIEFSIHIDAIVASKRSPNEYFCVHWSIDGSGQSVGCSLIVKLTDPFLFQKGIRTWRDIETNEIVSANKIAEALIGHLVIIETGYDIDHTIQFFFADRPDGGGPFDGIVTWTHKQGFDSF